MGEEARRPGAASDNQRNVRPLLSCLGHCPFSAQITHPTLSTCSGRFSPGSCRFLCSWLFRPRVGQLPHIRGMSIPTESPRQMPTSSQWVLGRLLTQQRLAARPKLALPAAVPAIIAIARSTALHFARPWSLSWTTLVCSFFRHVPSLRRCRRKLASDGCPAPTQTHQDQVPKFIP